MTAHGADAQASVEQVPRVRITFRQIEVFRAIMLTGSSTRAAELMRVSQPAISLQLSNLEAELGFSLFLRSGRKLVPSPEAQLLFEEVQRSFLGLSAITDSARAISQLKMGRLRVAVMPALATSAFFDAFAGFCREHPKIPVVLSVQNKTTLLQQIAKNLFDLAVASGPVDYPGIRSEHLLTGTAECIVPVEHPLAHLDAVTARDLEGHQLINLPAATKLRKELDIALEQTGADPSCLIEVQTAASLVALVERRLGIGLTTRSNLSEDLPRGLVSLPFEPRITTDIFTIFSENAPSSQAAENFVATLKRESG